MRCRFTWYSQGQQKWVRCAHSRTHRTRHEADPYTYVAIGAEKVVEGEWLIEITDKEIAQRRGQCAAVNPRTGWVCNEPPHEGDSRHITTSPNGERYD